jgi:hypothetical protein
LEALDLFIAAYDREWPGTRVRGVGVVDGVHTTEFTDFWWV